jgi:uncharacterized lipoprotein YajG
VGIADIAPGRSGASVSRSGKACRRSRLSRRPRHDQGHTVTVRPQVDGQLTKVLFREGQDVQRGYVLAEIGPRTYQAQLDQATARARHNNLRQKWAAPWGAVSATFERKLASIVISSCCEFRLLE